MAVYKPNAWMILMALMLLFLPAKLVAQDLPTKAFTGHKGCVYGLAVSPDGKLLATAGKDNTARIWDIVSGKLIRSFDGNGLELFAVGFDEKGKKLMAGGDGGDILCVDLDSGVKTYKANAYKTPAVRGIATGYGDVSFFAADHDVISVYYKNQSTPRKKVALAEFGIYNILVLRNIGKTNKLLISYSGGLAMLDPISEKLTKFPGTTISFACAATSNGKMVAGGMRTLYAFDPENARKANNFTDFDPETSAYNFFCADFSPDGNYLLAGYDSGELIVWEVSSRELITRFYPHDNFGCMASGEATQARFLGERSGFNDIRFLPDGKHFITCGNNGSVKMWDIFKLIPPAYAPDQLQKKLAIQMLEPAGFSPEKTMVNKDPAWLKIQGNVINSIGRVTVKVNGESINVDSDKDNNFKIALTPLPGLNTVVVEASDKRSTVKETILVSHDPGVEPSGPKSVISRPKPDPEPITIDLRVPRIYAVVVGVSNFQYHPEMALKFAAKDAKAYYEFLRSRQGGEVPEENITLLCEANATRANIMAAVAQKLDKSQRDDVFIFYYSGHGKIIGNNDGLCFMAYDSNASSMYQLGSTAIRQSELGQSLKESRVKKKVLFIDACHSGLMAYNGEKSGGNINNKLLKEMAKTMKATAVFTSSANNESSYEDETLDGGHGLFSYYLIQGLSGLADTGYGGDKNGFVTVNELHWYVNDQVSKRAKSIGREQHPDLGNDSSLDFPLAEITDKKKLPKNTRKN